MKPNHHKLILPFLGVLFMALSTLAFARETVEFPSDSTSIPDQLAFHQKIAELGNKYDAAMNEIGKSAVFREMVTLMRTYFINGRIENWEGTITAINTNEGGTRASVEIEANLSGSEIVYQTRGTLFEDTTTISPGSPVYDQLGQLPIGATVLFSGNFVPDSETGVSQTNLFERSKVVKPRLVIRFSSIQKKQE